MQKRVTVYGLTIVAVALALAARWLLAPLLGDHLPFATFFIAVVVTAWIGGLRPALLAMVLGFMCAQLLFVPTRFSIFGMSGPHVVGLAEYLLVSISLAVFGERIRVARQRVEEMPERLQTTRAGITDGFHRDNTHQQSAEALLTGQKRVLEMVATNSPLMEVLAATCDLIERQEPGLLCSVLLPDDQGQHTRAAAGASLPASYLRGLEGLRISRPYIGSCGEALDCGEAVIVPDVEADEKYCQPWRDHLLSHGLRSCRSLPVANTVGTILASFAFYRRDAGEPEPANKQLVEVATNLVAIAIEQRRGQQAIFDALADTQLLHRLTMEMSKPGEPLEFYERLMDAAVEIMHSDCASLQVLHPERGESDHIGELELVTFRGFTAQAAEFWKWVRPDSQSTCGVALRTGQRCDVPNAMNDSRITGDDLAMYMQTGIRAVQTTPLVARDGRLFGVISTHWKLPRDSQTVSERDWQMLDVLARCAADLMERIQAEGRVRKSEARLRRVFESNVVGMIRWDLDRSLILDANAEFLRMTGYTRDDVASGRLNFRNLTPPEWTARNEEGIRTIREEGHAAPYEKEYFRKDGSRVPLIIAGTQFEDSPSEGMSFLIDISEAKRAEADLRASEQRLRLIVESATGFAIFTMNTEGIIDSWNAGAERLFGYSEAEVVGQHDRFLYTPEDAVQKIPEREMKKAATEGRAVNERWHVRKGGDRFWGSGLVQPLRDEGNVVGFLKILRDMTEQREYEDRLRQAEEQFRTLADNMSQFAWMANEQGWIFWYNRRWYDYTGTTLEEMQGHGWQSVHHPDHVDRVVKRLQHSWDTGELWEDTFPLRGRDGHYRWFLSRAVPIRNEEGRILRWFGTNTDITEERELQQALLDADRRKDEFLATLAHELRNPLAPIRNGLELMRLAVGDDDAVEHARNMMDRQLGQMVRLVDDLMDVSRISRGKLELKRERVPLAAVVSSAVETSRPLIDQMGHELTVALPTDPIVVEADLTRLAQVFLNLLNNAAKYSERGGHIWLTAEPEGSDVVVTVKDKGIGIATDQLPHIFEMFTQVDRSLEKAHGGLGIGLTLVRRLVEMHNGRIEAFTAC